MADLAAGIAWSVSQERPRNLLNNGFVPEAGIRRAELEFDKFSVGGR
jgi:hypothetical protein